MGKLDEQDNEPECSIRSATPASTCSSESHIPQTRAHAFNIDNDADGQDTDRWSVRIKLCVRRRCGRRYALHSCMPGTPCSEQITLWLSRSLHRVVHGCCMVCGCAMTPMCVRGIFGYSPRPPPLSWAVGCHTICNLFFPPPPLSAIFSLLASRHLIDTHTHSHSHLTHSHS